MEEVHAVTYPIVLPTMSFIAFVDLDEGEPQNPELQMQLLLGEQELFLGPLQTIFDARRKTRVLADLNGLVIPAPGVLRAIIR
jgi:hypothetical protein